MATVEIGYDVGRSRSAVLAWGQQTTWDDIQFFLPEVKAFGVLGGWLPLDDIVTTTENVLQALAELVRRHEALRSRYYDRADQISMQTVLAQGAFAVEVLEVLEVDGNDVLVSAQAAAGDIFATGFDHDGGRPFRPVLVTAAGVPRLLIFGVSHVACDLAGANQLSEELLELIAGPSEPRPAWQPVDLAEFEQSPAGRRLDDAAQNHLRRQIETAPSQLLPEVMAPAEPRFWQGALSSVALASALRVLGRRYRTSTSTVLLALTTLIVNRHTDKNDCLIGLVQANRTAAELMHCTSSLSQTVQVTVFGGGVVTFADLVERTGRAVDQAQQHSRFDARRATGIVAEVERRRGHPIELSCRFNDTWSSLRRQLKRTGADAGEIRAAAATTKFGWLDKTDSDKIALFIDAFGTDEELELRALADTARIAPAGIEALLRAYEEIALQLLMDDLVLAKIDYPT